MPETVYADWNPWHGCTKISPGCKYCYVYRQDEQSGTELASSLCRKTANFVKNGRAYRILRKHQIPQARKANIDYLPKISCLQQKAAPNFKVPEQNR